LLEHERDRLTERIDLLTRNRDAVAAYLDDLRARTPSRTRDRRSP
jgi:hypothetical protein